MSWGDYNIVSCSNRVGSERYRGIGGYNGVDECESCRTWTEQLFGRVVCIKDEAEIANIWVVLRGQFCILTSCCLSPIRRNSVLEELRVSRLAVIQEMRFVVKHSRGRRC